MSGSRGGQRLLSLALVVAACGEEPSEPLDAELLGCAELWVSEGERLCVRVAEDPLLLVGELSDPAIGATDLRRVNEHSWALDTPSGVLTVRDGEREGRWHIETAPRDDTLEAAREHRVAGDPEAAAASLRAALGGADAPTDARRRAALARAVLASGDTDRALQLLNESAERAASIGFVSQALRDELAAVDTLRRAGRLDDALSRLEALSADSADHEGRAHLGYQRVLTARDSGDLRDTLRALDRTAAYVSRFDAHPRMRLVALDLGMVRARLLEGLGRSSEAAAALTEVESLAQAPCDRAAWQTNRGWVALQALESALDSEGESGIREAGDAFRGAAALHAPGGGCPDPARARNAAVNLALAAIAAGDLPAAEAHLTDAAAIDAPRDTRVEAWAALASARRLAIEDAPNAAERYRHIARMAEARQLQGVAWQAWLGLGRAERSRGRADEAVAAFEQAEALLEPAVDAVPLGEGRGLLADRRAASARALVDALLERGESAAALRALRRARSRPLRTLRNRAGWLRSSTHEADRWATYQRARDAERDHRRSAWTVLPDERAAYEEEASTLAKRTANALDALLATAPRMPSEPPPIGPSELLLAWAEGNEGWRVFAATNASVGVAPLLQAPAAGADTSPMFAPVADAIREAIVQGDTIRLLLPASLDAMPVHAFPFDGEPLLAAASVVVAVDAGVDTSRRTMRGSPLVVADPRGDLPVAREEGRRVARAGGQLLVGERANRDAVLARLATATHLHYAGHASPAGALLLANSEVVDVLDVLTSWAPRSAALIGCGTAAATGPTTRTVGTLGLAQAFVVAGSERVVATLRDVSDDGSAAFTRALGTGPLTAQSYRRAALAIRAEHPDDWDAFRLLVP